MPATDTERKTKKPIPAENSAPLSVADAAAQVAQKKADAETAAVRRREEAIAVFTKSVIAESLGQPVSVTPSQLTAAIEEIGASAERILELREIVQDAAEQKRRHADKAEANACVGEKQIAVRAVKERHEMELSAAERELSIANERNYHAALASVELLRLSRRAPDFFDMNANPPVLKS